MKKVVKVVLFVVLVALYLTLTSCDFNDTFGRKEGDLVVRICVDEDKNAEYDMFLADTRGDGNARETLKRGLEKGKLCADKFLAKSAVYVFYVLVSPYPQTSPYYVFLYQYNHVGNLSLKDTQRVETQNRRDQRRMFIITSTDCKIPILSAKST